LRRVELGVFRKSRGRYKRYSRRRVGEVISNKGRFMERGYIEGR
jgi:hypothetical protein